MQAARIKEFAAEFDPSRSISMKQQQGERLQRTGG
jgi:hypothetical protein